jgi:hypothetical protein
MTPDDALKAAACIEGIERSTRSGRRIARYLRGVLEQHPQWFWSEYFEMLSCENPVTIQSERLVNSGVVDSETTVDELPGILAVDHMEQIHRRQQRPVESNSAKGDHAE